MSRILAIDFGEKRIGLAVSDELGITAQRLSTFRAEKDGEFISHLKQIIDQKDIEQIVIGFPKMMDGTVGEKAKQVQKLAEDIKGRLGVPVTLWDERLSSIQSQKILRQMGQKYTRQKEKIDQLSAVLILQSYLDYKRRKDEQEK
jgi:putative holliday junction resolvase